MPKPETERWQLDDLIVDVGAQLVTRHEVAIPLPQLSFKFLLALVHGAPNILSADDLMEQVWAGVFVNAETVKQRAKLLRDSLGDDPKAPRYVAVRRGVGYQLLPKPVRLHGSDIEPTASRPAPTWRGRLVVTATALGLVAVGGINAAALWPARNEAAQVDSVRVAVLPFDNLSSDPADAYIARSIPEMVLNRLSSVGGLTVVARDSALLSPAAKASPRQAGAQLLASYVVKGSVQRVGKTVRVTCFVVDTGRDVRLWSERFDWPVDRLYALQDQIAERVASSLASKARGLGGVASAPIPTRNPDAYLAFLKGKSLLGRYTVAETTAAAGQFERAVQLDPDFSEAMVALFDAKMQGAALRLEDLGQVRSRYQPMLDRAVQRNPSSGAALFAKAMWSNEPAVARAELFRRAAELDPSNSRGLTAYAKFLDTGMNADLGAQLEGTTDGPAKAMLDRVLAIDPLSPQTRFWALQRRWTKMRQEEFLQAMARELELDPQNYILANRYAFRRWLNQGETADAIERIERVIASDPEQPLGPNMAVAFYLDVEDPAAARAAAVTTPATQASSRILLSQYRGDWRSAGDAAFSRGGYLFNVYQSWNWPQAVRDYALQTREYDRAAKVIATRFAFDLENPRTSGPGQANAAPALAHILLAKGDRLRATRLLAQTVQWIDAHPGIGLSVHMRLRATAMMLLGEQDEALSNLRASVESGHDIRHWWYVVERDPVWAPVHSDPRFLATANLYRQAATLQRAKLEALRRSGKVPTRTAS